MQKGAIDRFTSKVAKDADSKGSQASAGKALRENSMKTVKTLEKVAQ